MRIELSNWAKLLVLMSVLWHVFNVVVPDRTPTPPRATARDYASYYYAVEAAVGGDNPYDKTVLDALAAEEGIRGPVHPFFYPPPFVLVMSWASLLDLEGGYALWYWVNEALLVAVVVVLLLWWGPLGSSGVVALALMVAAMTGIRYNLHMGQANLLPMLLVLSGLFAAQRGRDALGGVLVGVACMLKMSPALFVLWWLVQRRFVAVGAAVATAVVTSLLALPVVGFDHQVDFYTRVLPAFASGQYNGLTIKIGMFGNHSVPNVLHQLFPSGTNVLSGTARTVSSLFSLSGLTALMVLFRRPSADELVVAARISAIAVFILLVPVYTYEHHLVWAIPAVMVGAIAVGAGRLHWAWGVLIGLAGAALSYDLPSLRKLAESLAEVPVLPVALQELKFVALVALLFAMARLAIHKEVAVDANDRDS